VKHTNPKKPSNRYGFAVRITALILSFLVAGGALTYLALLILQLF